MADLPLILHQDIPFSCFMGLLHGTITADVYDQGNCIFPTKLTITTNIGLTSLPVVFQGDEQIPIKDDKFKTDVDIVVSNWNCDQNTVSCHVKAIAKKGITCTVLDQDFNIPRHNNETFEALVADFHRRLEVLATI